MQYKLEFLNKVLFIAIILWSGILLGFTFNSVYKNYQDAFEEALHHTEHGVQKDLSFRLWVSSHGGVYVPVSKTTQPSPYLSHIAKRDIKSADGQVYTLLDPSYAMSQIATDYNDEHQVKGRATNSVVLNPDNKADKWELKGLKIIEQTGKAYYEENSINNEKYLRYLYPLKIQKNCLKCHAYEGFKEGDFRGAISLSMPLKSFIEKAYQQSISISSNFFVIWLIGIITLLIGYKKIRNYIIEKISDYEQHVFSLVDVIEKRDSYTAGHTGRVAKYTELISIQMGCSMEIQNTLRRSALLHDIGKISTPDSILLKPGKLSALEYDLIKEHVTTSYQLLYRVDAFKDIAEIVRHHHEHYDGNGYPQGLKGNKIPLLSCILTVADAFDAMTTNRIYKGRKTVDLAMLELRSLAGKQFHPQVVEATLKVMKDITISSNYNQLPKTEIEQERFSYFYKDAITGAYNRDYLEFVLSRRIDQAHLEAKDLDAIDHEENFFQYQCGYAFFLHHFTQYNKNNSWKQGDKLLRQIAEIFASWGDNSLTFRLYGDDFIALHKQHFDIEPNQLVLIDQKLENSGISMTYQHISLKKENIFSLSDLEKLL